MFLLRAATSPELTRWKRWKEAAWAAWVAAALAFAAIGGTAFAWALGISFGLLELLGLRHRYDDDPTLTEEIGRHVPGWIAFPAIALGSLRAYEVLSGHDLHWELYVLAGALAWFVNHFTLTYAERRGRTTWTGAERT